MDLIRLKGMEKLGDEELYYKKAQDISREAKNNPNLPDIQMPLSKYDKKINLPLRDDIYRMIQQTCREQELMDIDWNRNAAVDKPQTKTVQEATNRYSEEKVTAQELRGLADWLCEKFTFVYVEGLALYIYLDGRYVHFRYDFATRYLMYVFREYGVTIPLRSADYKELVRLLQAQPQIVKRQEECTTDVTRILYADGAFVAEGQGRMSKPNPKDYQFSKINFPLDWHYEYEASAEARNFIERFCNYDAEREAYLWELIGYLLSSYQQKIIVTFIGPSNSGKSTLANMIRRICGTETCVAMGIKELSGNFNLAELQGKRLCIDSEMEATTLNARDIRLLKKVVGNDLLQGNRKYESQFYFQCQTKFLFCSNNQIKFQSNEDTVSFFNRMKIFELKKTIPHEERNYNMDKILDENRTYFLQQAMKGLLRLVSNNFEFSYDEPPENFIKNVSGKVNLGSIDIFVKCCCQREAGYAETVANLYGAYKRFTEENDMEAVSDKSFSCYLVNTYYLVRDRKKNARLLRGMRLMTDDR